MLYCGMTTKLLGCVWDMDGVLVDSGAAHKAAWQALAAELGYTYSDAAHEQTFGMRNPDIIRIARNGWDDAGERNPPLL